MFGKLLVVACAVFSCLPCAAAGEPPAYQPLREDVDALKAKVNPPAYAGSSACGCGCVETGSCKCRNCDDHTADPNYKTAPDEYEYVQICDGQTCRMVKVKKTAQISEPISYPVFTSGGCASGGCAGYTVVNPSGPWAQSQPTTVNSCASGSCASGSCASGAGTGWVPFHPFQNLRNWRQAHSKRGCGGN